MTDTTDLTRAKDTLDRRIDAAAAALRADQRADGHWVYELEADATIPAEYVLLTHYLGEEPNLELERKIGVYLRSRQSADGGWPLFHNGAFDISASVKAYFALKMIGDDPDAAHMRTAREAIRARGGAAQVNVFTRFLLALYGNLPWSALPLMPVEITLLPRWFFFHLSKISYWGRTVLVPLLVLQALKPRARNKRGVRVDELFLAPPEQTKRHAKAPHQNRFWYEVFRAVDVLLKLAEPAFPRATRKRAIDKAAAFVRERLNGEDGLGAIFPAMANSVMMFDALGVPADNPERAIARKSIDKLLIVKAGEAYCQPCVSPVWDTALAAHALLETGEAGNIASAQRGLDWLKPAAGARREGRLGVQAAGRAARRLGFPIRQSALSRSRRHRGDRGRHGARAEGSAAPASSTLRMARGARMDRGPAIERRRLGRLRRRQHARIPQQHPVRRPRRAARSALARSDRALRVDAGAARRDHGQRRRPCGAASTTCAARNCPTAPGTAAGASITSTAPGRRCARSMPRAWPRRAGNEARRRLADRDPERGRRLGRGWRQLQARLSAAMRKASARRRKPPGLCSA